MKTSNKSDAADRPNRHLVCFLEPLHRFAPSLIAGVRAN